jgi:hypothetical protein
MMQKFVDSTVLNLFAQLYTLAVVLLKYRRNLATQP